MAGCRNPADGNIETYPGRRVERIAISIESPGAAPSWHHDAVEVNALVAAMGDAPSSVIAFLPDGSSCGGIISLEKNNLNYAVRFNWLTGLIDVVQTTKS